MLIEKGSIRRRNRSVSQRSESGDRRRSSKSACCSPMHFLYVGVLLLVLLAVSGGCGYKVRSSVGTLPSGSRSIGIPTFRNLTGQYKLEQLLSSAVLREFTLRSNADVTSRNAGVDLVLIGEIQKVTSTPVVFGNEKDESQTFGSAFLVTVELGVKLVRSSDSSVIWQNDRYLYRERYALNGVVRDFFSEENPALARLAKDFAASLASTILDRRTP